MVEASEAWWKHRRHSGSIGGMVEESEQGGRIRSRVEELEANIGGTVETLDTW
jgi:hypothetical protein